MSIEPEVMERELEDHAPLSLLNKSEIDTQIATAKKYPRSVRQFVLDASEMACLNEEIAGECMYALKRGNKVIEGPSARFAEIAMSAWGNARAAARVVDEDGRFVTAQGAFIDLQRNVAITYESRRRITDKHGRRYNDDMIGVTANAACSIALRNAVLKGIPKAFWKAVYDEARRTAIGDASTLTQTRIKMIEHFQRMGVDEAQVLSYLGRKGVEDITLDDVAALRGMATAIRDGETTIDQTFGAEPQPGGRAKPSELNKPKESTEPEKPPEEAAEDAQEPTAGDPDPYGPDVDQALEDATTVEECNEVFARFADDYRGELSNVLREKCEARCEAILKAKKGKR